MSIYSFLGWPNYMPTPQLFDLFHNIHLYLEELNQIPEEFKTQKLESKGFHSEITFQDFPLRGKEVFMHVKRRRWLNHDTGKVVSRDWSVVANGTRISKDFAAFLKQIHRYAGA